jgi:hypothetical protein
LPAVSIRSAELFARLQDLFSRIRDKPRDNSAHRTRRSHAERSRSAWTRERSDTKRTSLGTSSTIGLHTGFHRGTEPVIARLRTQKSSLVWQPGLRDAGFSNRPPAPSGCTVPEELTLRTPLRVAWHVQRERDRPTAVPEPQKLAALGAPRAIGTFRRQCKWAVQIFNASILLHYKQHFATREAVGAARRQLNLAVTIQRFFRRKLGQQWLHASPVNWNSGGLTRIQLFQVLARCKPHLKRWVQAVRSRFAVLMLVDFLVQSRDLRAAYPYSFIWRKALKQLGKCIARIARCIRGFLMVSKGRRVALTRKWDLLAIKHRPVLIEALNAHQKKEAEALESRSKMLGPEMSQMGHLLDEHCWNTKGTAIVAGRSTRKKEAEFTISKRYVQHFREHRDLAIRSYLAKARALYREQIRHMQQCLGTEAEKHNKPDNNAVLVRSRHQRSGSSLSLRSQALAIARLSSLRVFTPTRCLNTAFVSLLKGAFIASLPPPAVRAPTFSEYLIRAAVLSRVDSQKEERDEAKSAAEASRKVRRKQTQPIWQDELRKGFIKMSDPVALGSPRRKDRRSRPQSQSPLAPVREPDQHPQKADETHRRKVSSLLFDTVNVDNKFAAAS